MWPGAADLGEGPLWSSRARSLYWVDILRGQLHRYAPASGTHQSWDLPGTLSSVSECEVADILLVTLGLDYAFFDPGTGALHRVHSPEPGGMGNRLNDAKIDSRGRLWVGSMDLGLRRPSGVLHHWAGGAEGARHLSGPVVCNGPAWSPDGRTLYFCDTVGGEVLAFDFDVDAPALSRRRLFARFEGEAGRPDGLTTDTLGRVWIAHWGGSRVSCFGPDGAFLAVIPLPVSQVTSCAFGGDQRQTLYVTSARTGLAADQLAVEPLAGGLFAIETSAQGLAPNRFAGVPTLVPGSGPLPG